MGVFDRIFTTLVAENGQSDRLMMIYAGIWVMAWFDGRRIVAGVKASQNFTRSNTPMKNDTSILPFRQSETIADPLTELAREGARQWTTMPERDIDGDIEKQWVWVRRVIPNIR
jgi:hypothetical protein